MPNEIQIKYDDPEDGPWGLGIVQCMGMIAFEEDTILWAKERLQDEELTPKQRQLYGEVLSDAKRVLLKYQTELEEIRTMHFRWLWKRDSA